MKWAIFTAFLFGAWPLFATQILNPAPLEVVSATAGTTDLPIGANTGIDISLRLAPQHHAYQTQINVKLKESFKEHFLLSSANLSPIVEFFDPISKKTKKGVGPGLSRAVVILEPKASAPTGHQKIEFIFTYQACTKKYCLLPKKIPFEVPINILPSTGEKQFDTHFSLSKPSSVLEAIEKNLWLAFALVFLAGILTSFTPCIFPMIPITLAVLGARSNPSKTASFLVSLSYVFGIALTYSLLGVAAASTGALFGSFLGHPAVAIGLGVLFVILALSMFGLFEIQLPTSLQTKLGLHKTQGGHLGAFMAGTVAGALASPCVGPVLVGLLAYVAKSQNIALGFFLLMTFALGMGQIFLVLGTFTNLLKKLPKAGGWMTGVKVIMGSCMLALAVFYVQPVLPPGFLTIGSNDEMDFENFKSNIQWKKYSNETFASAKANGKPVIVDFYADWCLACKEMEIQTFAHPTVDEIKNQFVWVKFDATKGSKEFDELRKKYGIVGLPWFVFYDSQGNYISEATLSGYEKPQAFRERILKLK